MVRVALYARVSTDAQDTDLQLREMREICERRKWTIYAEFIDSGVSGAAVARPELDRLMLESARGKFDAVMVWRFDRFARSVSHLLKALEEFRGKGIDFVSVTENIDTSTAMGKMVFTIIAAVAELERSLIGERVKAGIRSAQARGVSLGRPKLPVASEDVWNLVRVRGKTIREAATDLSVSPATIINRLNRRSHDID
ncbi:MAG: recombinase family protein [Candidatus Acidiferrales bacterium]